MKENSRFANRMGEKFDWEWGSRIQVHELEMGEDGMNRKHHSRFQASQHEEDEASTDVLCSLQVKPH
jgi:hypothetical protein